MNFRQTPGRPATWSQKSNIYTSSPIPESRSWREPFWWWESSSKRKVGSVVCLATKGFVKPLASFSMIHVLCNLRKPMLCKQKQSRKNVNGCSFPATFSVLTNQVSLFAVERFSHVDQRIEVWKHGGGFVVNLLTRKICIANIYSDVSGVEYGV